MDSTATDIITEYWGLSGFWDSWNWPMQISLVLLIILSLVTSYVILITLVDQHSWLRAARSLRKRPATAESIGALLVDNDKRLKIFRNVAEAGVHAAADYGDRLVERVSFSEWVGGSIERAIGREQRNLKKGIAILPVTGVIAPAVAIYIAVIILLSCVSRYSEITLFQPSAESMAIPPHAPIDERGEASKNETSPTDEGESHDFSKSQGAPAGTPPSESLGPDPIPHISYNEHMIWIYRWVGQALRVLLAGVFIVVTAFGGYLTILARNRALEGLLRDFADELIGILLTSPPPREMPPDAVAEPTPVPAT